MRNNVINYKAVIESILVNQPSKNLSCNINADLSDLTIIIPTNKFDFVYESIEFYRLFEFIKIKYVIYNSSSQRASKTDYKNIEIIYYETDYYNWVDHFLFAASLVETSFVLLHGDDDFINVENLISGYKFMILNPDYSMYYGQTTVFTYKKKLGKPMFSYDNKYINNKDIKFSDVNDRIRLFYKNYVSSLPGLTRRELLLEVYELLSLFKPNNGNLGELFRNTHTIASGKIFINNDNWIFRRGYEGSWGSTEVETFKDERIEYKNQLESYSKILDTHFKFNIGEYSIKMYEKYNKNFRRIKNHYKYPIYTINKILYKIKIKYK